MRLDVPSPATHVGLRRITITPVIASSGTSVAPPTIMPAVTRCFALAATSVLAAVAIGELLAVYAVAVAVGCALALADGTLADVAAFGLLAGPDRVALFTMAVRGGT